MKFILYVFGLIDCNENGKQLITESLTVLLPNLKEGVVIIRNLQGDLK